MEGYTARGRTRQRISQPSMRPNLIIIGAAKCGTQALHHYLGLHPEVSMSQPNELDFFVEEVNWGRGLDWYESHFTGMAKIYGESSPSYTRYPKFKGVPARLFSVVPDAKLIYVVRDPVARIISHYRFNRVRGARKRGTGQAPRKTLHAVLRSFDNVYVWQSMYGTQLRQHLAYFPLSRILVVSQEDLLEQRRATLQEVFDFLGVDGGFYHPDFDVTRHTTASLERRQFGDGAPSKPELEEEDRQRLVEHLRGDVDDFRSHVGRSFENWCV